MSDPIGGTLIQQLVKIRDERAALRKEVDSLNTLYKTQKETNLAQAEEIHKLKAELERVLQNIPKNLEFARAEGLRAAIALQEKHSRTDNLPLRKESQDESSK